MPVAQDIYNFERGANISISQKRLADTYRHDILKLLNSTKIDFFTKEVDHNEDIERLFKSIGKIEDPNLIKSLLSMTNEQGVGIVTIAEKFKGHEIFDVALEKFKTLAPKEYASQKIDQIDQVLTKNPKDKGKIDSSQLKKIIAAFARDRDSKEAQQHAIEAADWLGKTLVGNVTVKDTQEMIALRQKALEAVQSIGKRGLLGQAGAPGVEALSFGTVRISRSMLSSIGDSSIAKFRNKNSKNQSVV
jgi:hypothetical protein